MLPSLTVAFLAGLCIGSFIPFFPLTLLALLLSIAVAVTLGERRAWIDPRRAGWLYGTLLSGCLYWVWAVPIPVSHQPPPDRREEAPADMIGRITAPVQHAPGRQTLLLDLERVTPPPVWLPRAERIRLVWREPDKVLLQGDRIVLRSKLHPPSGTLNPGGFDYAGYLERQGIDAVSTVTGPGAVHVVEPGGLSRRWAVWHAIDRWRAAIRDAAIRTLSQPALGLFLGIIIGERGYLAQDVQEWFMATGTVHLLSISGSHLGLVAVIGFWLVKRGTLALPVSALLTLSRVATPSRSAILLTWPIVLLYALLAGAELATIRSLIMITLAFMALWLGYERRLHHALAAAALLIVVHDPRAIYDLSFQLSFLSVLVIVQVLAVIAADGADGTPDTPGLLATVTVSVRDAVLMSGAVTLATFPVVAFYFNQAPWMGIVTNLLAIPVTGVLLVPLGLLSAAWTVATGADHVALGSLQERLSVWFIEGLRWCADVPGSRWHVSAPALPSIAVFYMALWTASRRLITKPVRLCCAMVVVGLAVWWIWSPRIGLDGDRWRVTFLDVGQGDSAVVESPDGQTVLIDGGARYERFDMGRSVVGPFLWNRGIRRLDHVIGTHQQLDHVGGLVWLLRHIDVRRYWNTGVERQEQFVLDLRQALREAAIPEQLAVQGDELLPSGPCRLTILNPTSSVDVRPVVHSNSGSWLNNRSIVSRLQCGTHAVLFAADIEVDGLRRLSGDGNRPVTVVKVPHHGAKSSLDLTWISNLHPRYAVISVGRSNSYGHPVQAVLDAYAHEQASILRTDRDGAIWITGRVSSSDLVLIRMRDLLLQPVDPYSGLWRGERENWRRVLLQLRQFHPLPLVHI